MTATKSKVNVVAEFTGTLYLRPVERLATQEEMSQRSEECRHQFFTTTGKPYVEVGQRVEADQTLALLEAMHMFAEIQSPVSGTVVEILYKEGVTVEREGVLMVIESD